MRSQPNMEKDLATAISFLIFLSFSSQVSSLDTLKPGEKLYPSAELVSAKNIFTLGFYSPGNTNKSYLGIWYTKGKSGRPVWLANRNIPMYKNSGFLKITRSGKLIIMHGGGEHIELYAAESGTNITATLLDTGNFVVKEINSNGNSGSKVLWQSFDYPTDTLLPGMKLGVNHETGRNWTLTSWFSESNPASGAFTLEWDWIRHGLLVRRRGVVYWTSGDLKFYKQFGNIKLYAFDNIVFKPDAITMNYIFSNVTNEDEESFSYALYIDPFLTPEHKKSGSGLILHYEGNIYQFYRRFSIAQVELCYGYNTRGSEVYVGCELWAQPKCRNGHQNFTFLNGYFLLDNGGPFNDNNTALSESDCRANCWNDCTCFGFKAEETGCTYWRGKQATFLQDNSLMSRNLYVLLSEPSKKRDKLIIIFVPIAAVVLSTLVSSFFLVKKLKQVKWRKKKELLELMTLEGFSETLENSEDGGHDLIQFSYASILTSTNNFATDNKLGEGGFGPVYKGKMPQGHDVAVKLLSQRSGQGLLEFKTELVLMSKLQHRNLVKLLGFCIHGNDKVIIYDYLPNKSLDFVLFDPVKREQLSWKQRFNIIEGIAQGLLYLHKYARLLIIHRDLKASNILLDDNMNPKISDFGLARIFKQNVTEESTNKCAGTFGYMAPEYVMNGRFSVKSDIYSFGVLILEIVSGRRNNSFRNLEGPLSLVEFAWELWKQSTELDLMDSVLENSCMNAKDQLRSCIQVGLLLVQNRAADRPPIEDVISMLRNEINPLPMPQKPAFVPGNNVVPILQKPHTKKFSLNEVSLSSMSGR